MRNFKDQILAVISDSISDLLYYARKEDEVPVGAIEYAVAKGQISAEEIIALFSATLLENLDPTEAELKDFEEEEADWEQRLDGEEGLEYDLDDLDGDEDE